MTRTRPSQEFDEIVLCVFNKLRLWSGEAFATTSAEDGDRGWFRAQIDTGKMAALRRGLKGDGSPIATVGWVIEDLIPSTWNTESTEYRSIYQASVMYTMHKHSAFLSNERPYGPPVTRAFRAANPRGNVSDDDSKAQDRRINLLLDCSSNELFGFMRRVFVPLMNKSEVHVDWLQLARDFRDWDTSGQPVQLRWSRGWYGGQPFMNPSEPRDEDDSETVDLAM